MHETYEFHTLIKRAWRFSEMNSTKIQLSSLSISVHDIKAHPVCCHKQVYRDS